MKRNILMSPRDFHSSSFLSCEKDLETILRKLFIESEPYSEKLKRLLVINTKDCLDNTTSEVYKEIIANTTLKSLYEDEYIMNVPRITMNEHEEMKAQIIITFNDFFETSNQEFRDCTINFDIICNTACWDIGDFRVRPLKIAGYIDGILNKCRLSGIGQLQFVSCQALILDENLSGYTLTYTATHGTDDVLPIE